MIVASPFAQFDGDRFYDSDYVRMFRKKLLDYVRSSKQGFGLRFDGKISNLDIKYIDDQWIKITYSMGSMRFSTRLWISSNGEVTQSTIVSCDSTGVVDVNYTLSLELSVNRASYGQLTEGGPIPIPPLRNEMKLVSSGYRWAIINENLDAMIEGALYQDGEPVRIAAGIMNGVVTGRPASGTFNGRLQVTSSRPCTLTATFHLKQGRDISCITPCVNTHPPSGKGHWRLGHSPSSVIIIRNLEYILSCCTVPVGNDAICFITDHVALPLGWNRDN
jgi:uncharacterized protein